MVKDIYPGPNNGNPSLLTNVNGTLFFTANDGVHGVELWKSDGTANGTVMVKDILFSSAWSDPKSLTAANGLLYFSATDQFNGRELWRR